MTVLWILLTMMTSAAAVLVAVPFLRKLDERRAAPEREQEIYRDQLREVERETASGLIEPGEAEAASQEIKRRLLAAGQSASTGAAALSPMHRQYAVIAIAGFVVMGSTILYAVSGRPDLPSATPGARMLDASAAPQMRTGGDAEASQAQPQPPARSQGGGNIGTVDDMIARVLARVQQNPKDVESWRLLGWSYASTERWAQSAEAYAKAVALKPDAAALQSAYGEVLVRANGGMTDTAKTAFDAALKLDPKDPRARFFAALIQADTGDKSGALEAWIALLNDAAPKDDWVPDLRQRIVELAKELRVDVTARLPKEQQAAASDQLEPLRPLQIPQASQQPSGPNAEDVRNAEAMTPDARQTMIRTMVQGLADRLEKSPRDGDGWIRLIQARKVLGETDGAKLALEKALTTFADIPQEQDRIRTAARELGVTP